MARPPNYSHERNERERAKANKKAEKLAAKAAAKKQEALDREAEPESPEQPDE